MNDIPDGYYRAENGMVKQKPEQQVIEQQSEPLDLAALQSMTKEALIALIQRIGAARWGDVAIMTKEQRREAATLKLWHAGLTQPDIFKALPALREAMDRDTGKPAQSIAMTVEDKGLSKLSTDRLLALERELARVTGQDALVIAPEPKPLEND